jgi:hypothetical protein
MSVMRPKGQPPIVAGLAFSQSAARAPSTPARESAPYDLTDPWMS